MSAHAEPSKHDFDTNAGASSRTCPARARWPERILELAARSNRSGGADGRERSVSEIWLLLNAALAKYVRLHAGRMGSLPVEDVREIVAEKALELMQKLGDGRWNPLRSTPAQLCTLISTVARNGTIDRLRNAGPARLAELDAAPPRVSLETGETALERRRFAVALRECVRQLSPKARFAWFLRVFHEAPTKLIARHPRVTMSAGGVDVMLARARARVKRCMARKDHAPRELPPGTFATLWELFHERKP